MKYSVFFKLNILMLLVYFSVVIAFTLAFQADLIILSEVVNNLQRGVKTEVPKFGLLFNWFCDPGGKMLREIEEISVEKLTPDEILKLQKILGKINRNYIISSFGMYTLGVLIFFIVFLIIYRKTKKSIDKIRLAFEKLMNHEYGYTVTIEKDFKEFREMMEAFNKASKAIENLNDMLLECLKEKNS